MQKTPSPWPFIISLALLTISGATLVLLLPQLFQSGSNPEPWLFGALAGVAAIGALGTRLFRPERPKPGDSPDHPAK